MPELSQKEGYLQRIKRFSCNLYAYFLVLLDPLYNNKKKEDRIVITLTQYTLPLPALLLMFLLYQLFSQENFGAGISCVCVCFPPYFHEFYDIPMCVSKIFI